MCKFTKKLRVNDFFYVGQAHLLKNEKEYDSKIEKKKIEKKAIKPISFDSFVFAPK